LEALAHILAYPPELVLLDNKVKAPREISLLQHLHEHHPELPIIAFVSSTHPATEKDPLVAATLRKPFKISHLLQELQRVLGTRNVA